MTRGLLERRIASLRGRVRRLLALYGTGWVVAALLAATMTAGLLDWLVPGHLAREVRLALLIAVVGLVGWLAAKLVVRPLIIRFRDLDIALKIERRWPGLNDRLTSTVQFLQMSDRPGDRDDIRGSQALRDATIRQTLAEVESIDFREAVDPRPARKAAAAAGSALAVGLLLVVASPSLSRIALARFLNPFGDTAWPKQTHLQIVRAPGKVAKGEEFRIEVAVAKGDRVPPSARATYRFDDGRSEVESLRPDDRGHFHGRRESVAGSFHISISAGDDDTAPRRVEVVPPPSLGEITVRVTPPPYTGLPRQTLAAGRTDFQAVQGTSVEIEAVANKPIATASLRRGERESPLKVEISPAGRTLTSRFTVAESGPFWFELKDTEGFRGQDKDTVRFDLRAVRDEPPKVVIAEPTNDREVTPNATVPVAITADDDFGLGMVRLVYKVAPTGSEPKPETIIPLWSAEGSVAPTKRKDVPHIWDLASLNLTPGAIVTFRADARDLDAIHPNGPKLGRSRELRLRIATPEEINRQLESQRLEVREEVKRILAMQEQARTPVDEARRALDKLDTLEKPALDDLSNAAVIQGQVADRVINKADGLDQKIGRYLDDLKNLKVENPDAQKQMEDMRQGVERIKDNHLTPAEQGLTRASKSLEQNNANSGGDQAAQPEQSKADTTPSPESKNEPNPPDAAPARNKPNSGEAPSSKNEPNSAKGESKNEPNSERPTGKNEPNSRPTDPARQSLAQSAEHQKAISDELNQMLDSLKEFDTVRNVVQDAKALLKAQEEAMKAAQEAATKPDLTGKTPDALDPQQKVDLANLGARQGEIAKDLQSLENKMDEMSGRLDPSDPLGASGLREAAQQSRQKGTSSKASEAASQLEKNQMGSAQAGQKQVQADLKSMIDNLQNRREHELSRLVKELKNAEKALEDLRNRQANNKDKTGQAAKNQNEQERKAELAKLAKEQEDIQKELKKQLQKLQKLRADAAAQAGSKAASKMSKAQEDQEQDDAEDAQQQQEDALADLDEAQEETRQARREAEEQLAMEQLMKMADTLKLLAEQQDKVLNETADYQAKQAGDQKLTRAQQAGVRSLGRAQLAVRDETNTLIERMADAPVFELTLKRAVASMDLAAERLASIQTDDETQAAERSASRRFKQLLDALKPDPAEAGGPQPPQQGGEGGQGGQQGGGDGITTAAQIKMLKALQQELNDRTEELDLIRGRGKALSPQQDQELVRLEDDQRGIADLARDLTKPKHDDGEED